LMKRWVLSHRDSQETIDRIRGKLSVSLDLPRSAQVSAAEPSEGVIFVNLDKRYTFIETQEETVPFLGSQETLGLFPSARVDEGAIKFVLNGADVMRPGIRTFDEWGEAGRLVVVREEKKGRGISVGRSLLSSSEMARVQKGPSLKNLHYVGDRFWNLYKLV